MNPEQAKYEQLWSEHPQYRIVAPGENLADSFLQIAKPQSYHTVADFGCGTGRGALRIREKTGATVRMFDFSMACLDTKVACSLGEGFSFTQHDLTEPFAEKFDLGYCTDVMEHIPPEDVERVLLNLGVACKRLFLCISTEDDVMGALIGAPLHLTVKPALWWHTLLEELGFRVDASQDLGSAVMLYASLYANGEDFCEHSDLNVELERVKDNIRKNLGLGLAEIAPHEAQDTHVCVLAGGPSLADFEDEIVEMGRRGVPMVTMNGTYKWLADRGIKPAAMFMVDARELNERFVHRIYDGCKYIFSSQAAHEAVKKTPAGQTLLYHSSANETLNELFAEQGPKREWYPVPGGSTVTTRALVALAMLGFRNIEVFGWDSCLRDDKHHAYDQPENDGQAVVEIRVGEKTFKCHPWMVIQAEEAKQLVRHIFGKIPDFNLCVRGDGLIAHILNHAAALADA